MMTEPLIIVLVEDDEGHAKLIQLNLERAGVANEIIHVKAGQEALDLVRGQGAYAGRNLRGPLLLLLDISMPGMDGIEVLRQMKADPALARLPPVIMLTTTDDPREIQRCYELGCNMYIIKPVIYEAFVDAIRRLGFFLQIVQLPAAPHD
jgi:CheY-like chemotaxis protein